jgi:prolyl 4-hydroxylase
MTKEELDGDRIFVIHDFLSRAECVELIRRSESLAWAIGTVGGDVVGGVRNNERVLFDDLPLATDFFRRARPFLPNEIDRLALVGFNERWRFYRYGPGQTFKPHRDGTYQRFEKSEESHLTFMIYLNDQMAGGQTRFFGGMEEAFLRQPYLSVQPKEGTALVFVHRIWHEGAVVESGQKYVLRTDVMYGRPAKT